MLRACRPPHGGRGLKYNVIQSVQHHRQPSPPARGAWIEISIAIALASHSQSRPPHGGRGLKYA